MPGSLILHVVRHGESTDNLKSLWAGHKDAPLSNHGMRQAGRLGDSLSTVRIARIYCSDLKRAHWTAIQVQERNRADATATSPPRRATASLPSSPDAVAGPLSPETVANGGGESDPSRSAKESGDDDCDGAAAPPHIRTETDLPAPITTPLLREQSFGAAEGQPWSTGPFAHHDWGDYRFKFEGGESLVDVGHRADQVVQRIILPWANVAAGGGDVVVVIVAHGIMISQLGQALLRHSMNPKGSGHFGGLMNTSYHTFAVQLADPPAVPLTAAEISQDSMPPPYEEARARYALQIQRLGEVGHLDGLKRQRGGIGRMAHDSNQTSLTDFFAGGGASPSPSKRTARA